MFNLERAERVIIAVLAAGLLAGLAVGVWRASRPAPPLEITRFDPADYKTALPIDEAGSLVNINTATAEELATLKGVGKVLAERIVAYREAHGLFLSPDDLARVRGIGPALLEKNRGRVTLE